MPPKKKRAREEAAGAADAAAPSASELRAALLEILASRSAGKTC